MLLHIINETSYHLQSVLVEGSFALSSILSLLVEESTMLLVVTISQSFVEIVNPDRPAAKSIFLISHCGSTIMELERPVALGIWFRLSIVLDGLPPVSDSKSTTCLTISGISLCVSGRSSIYIIPLLGINRHRILHQFILSPFTGCVSTACWWNGSGVLLTGTHQHNVTPDRTICVNDADTKLCIACY